MDVPKYMADLRLMKAHYQSAFQNPEYQQYARAHIDSYKSAGGIVWGGKYLEQQEGKQ